MGLVGVTELSDAQKKQLKEQQEVRHRQVTQLCPKMKGHMSINV